MMRKMSIPNMVITVTINDAATSILPMQNLSSQLSLHHTETS